MREIKLETGEATGDYMLGSSNTHLQGLTNQLHVQNLRHKLQT